MSIRWRLNGDMICAAMSKAEPDDCYINDRLHFNFRSYPNPLLQI